MIPIEAEGDSMDCGITESFPEISDIFQTVNLQIVPRRGSDVANDQIIEAAEDIVLLRDDRVDECVQ